MVGTSRKDSTKDEVRTSTLGYVQALRKAGHEPRQGSAMSAWGAPSPRSRPAGVEVSLDKADAVIEGLRLFDGTSGRTADLQIRSATCSCCLRLALDQAVQDILRNVEIRVAQSIHGAPQVQ